MASKHAIKFSLIAKFFKENDKQFTRGENAYTSGHVLKMRFLGDFKPAQLYGEVRASMKKKTYKVEIKFDLEDGVVDATCTCPRGQVICSHMAALLFYAHYNVSATDTSCEWNAPTTSKETSEDVKSLEEIFPQKEDYCATKEPLPEAKIEQFKSMLGQTNVVGFSWLLKKESNDDIAALVPAIDEILFSQEYINSGNKEEYFVRKCCLTQEKIISIARATIGQHENENWLITRKLRVTASKFGAVLNACKKNRYPPSFFKQLLEGYNLNRALAVQWGKSNEKTALLKFMEVTGLVVEPTGLWLDSCGFLGGSPDGLIGDNAVLEIKCPYSFRNTTIREAVEDRKYLFFYSDDDEVFTNPEHNYYHQIQGQLYVTNRQQCYFFVWTPNDYEVILIERASEWEPNIDVIKDFYLKKFIPAILEM